MPYVSDAQRRWAHTVSAKKAGFPTAEFDRASKGQKKLPEHVAKREASKRAHKGFMKGLSKY